MSEKTTIARRRQYLTVPVAFVTEPLTGALSSLHDDDDDDDGDDGGGDDDDDDVSTRPLHTVRH